MSFEEEHAVLERLSLDDWIIVANRNSELLEDAAFLGLSTASRGIFLMIWLIDLAEGPVQVRRLADFGVRGGGLQLAALSVAGFIELKDVPAA